MSPANPTVGQESVGKRENAIYSARFSETENQNRDRIWQVLVEDVFQPMIRSDATVLDLGCGFGEFLRHVKCARRIGVDINSLSQKTLIEYGIEFHCGSICTVPFLHDGSVDVVFSSNVLEHLPDKHSVDFVLREAHRVLKPGGQIVLMGPNVRLIPGLYWDYWDHYVPISDRSLAEALRIVGFTVADQIAAFMPYTTKSRLPKRTWMVRLYVRNRWVWPLLGRQFLLRAVR